MSEEFGSIERLRHAVDEQAANVRTLKEQKADKAAVKEAVDKLLALKADLKERVDKLNAASRAEKEAEEKRRDAFDKLLKRRFFVVPAFEIYGGVGGLYDFGPPGNTLLQNIIAEWRKHFVLHEDMLEISSPSMTPLDVLATSGHVEKFTDFMVRDSVTKDCYRADKLLEDHIEGLIESDPTMKQNEKERLTKIRAAADAYDAEELGKHLKDLKVTAPETGNELTDPFPFNLMFKTDIGPTGKAPGFLRPETAQGIFVNFRRLIDYNAGAMPFAAAQIGTAFRNEIAPRAGLLRVREFTLAEIEHFVNPDNKSHTNFASIADVKLRLLSQDGQESGTDRIDEMTMAEAVEKGVINCETLAYFMARTYLFLVKIGITESKLRFRQHLKDEMAHYAADCWDAEIKSTYGWVECVGHADRSAFDLKAHSKETKTDMIAQERLPEPIMVEEAKLKMNRGKLGKKYGKASQILVNDLNDMDKETIVKLCETLETEGKMTHKVCSGEEFDLEKGDVSVTLKETKVSTIKYTPSVIEPSFGLGRILYCVLEHSYDNTVHEDEARAVLRLPALVAPVKVGLFTLSVNDAFTPFLAELRENMIDYDIASKTDNSGAAIGRKYARTDEIGVPFAITIDFQTVEDRTVTIRERDTCEQIRVSIDEVGPIIIGLVKGKLQWSDAYNKYEKVVR